MAHSTRTTLTTVIPGPLDLIWKLRRFAQERMKRRQVAKLLDCDERLLEDMGITRADVVEALSKSGNASMHLRVIAARRRFWTHNREPI